MVRFNPTTWPFRPTVASLRLAQAAGPWYARDRRKYARPKLIKTQGQSHKIRHTEFEQICDRYNVNAKLFRLEQLLEESRAIAASAAASIMWRV